MMHVYVNRFVFGNDSTLSHLYMGGEFKCFILEDQVRDGEKVYGETAIPFGTFEAKLRKEGGFHNRYTRRFADDPVINHIGMIHLQDVPNFTYIQLHPGNTDEDTKGCPMTGLDPRKRPDGKNNYNVGRATDAYRLVYPALSKELDQGGKVLFHFEKHRN